MSQDVGKTRASDCTSSTVVTCEKEKEGNMDLHFNVNLKTYFPRLLIILKANINVKNYILINVAMQMNPVYNISVK